MKKTNTFKNKNILELAISQINASCSKKINSDTLISCVKGENKDNKWAIHVWTFLEELPVEIIHDIVLSRKLTFEELDKAVNTWRCMDGDTVFWIREMAALSLETAAQVII